MRAFIFISKNILLDIRIHFKLFILSDDGLFLISNDWNRSRLRVESSIGVFCLLLLFGGFEEILLFEDVAGNLTMSCNSLDLRMSAKLLLESLVVSEGVFFARIELKIILISNRYRRSFSTNSYRPKFLGCVSFPDANVHFVRATEHIFVVQAPTDRCDVLLTFGMIDFS